MTSTTVAQQTAQPLNFEPEWRRASSTTEPTTPKSTSSTNTSGNAFKPSTNKYRYSKEQILGLRANVTERLCKDIRNEILENLKDTENVYRSNIIEPLALTAPTSDENAKLNSLSNYSSGRITGGVGRGSSNSQQSQQHDSRGGRGGASSSYGRGSSRGRGMRDNAFGPNRGTHNAEESGDNKANGDESFTPWPRGSGSHPRDRGFGQRLRNPDNRDSTSGYRRGINQRAGIDGGHSGNNDDEGPNDHSEESPTVSNGSATGSARGGLPWRTNSGPMEYRPKTIDKRNYNDDRIEKGATNSHESNQSRGFRPTTNIPERDINSRRQPMKQKPDPEWMNNDNDDINQLGSATFEHDGTFVESSSSKQTTNNNSEQQKLQAPSSNNDPSPNASSAQLKQQANSKPEQAISQSIETNTISATKVPEPNVSNVKSSTLTCDDDFEPSDVATTVVEATLAEDPEYFPPKPTYSASHHIPVETNPLTMSFMTQHRSQPQPQPQQPQTQPEPQSPVIVDDKQWLYKDPQNVIQGPFSSADMERWYNAGYFVNHLPVKRLGDTHFATIQQLINELGYMPFRTDAPSIPSPVQQQQQPQTVILERQNFNSMVYAKQSLTNNTFLDDYLMQQHSKQNSQHSTLFNRQTSAPVVAADRKPAAPQSISNSQLQAFYASQQQQQQQPHSQSASSMFSSDMINDSAIVYQQQSQLQRNLSVTNQQKLLNDIQHSFHQTPTQSTVSPSAYFGSTAPPSQPEQPDDIITRLALAMQNHGQQQQEKHDEQRRIEQQRREMERLKLAQAEQIRLQREEEERRKLERYKEEELRKKKEVTKPIVHEQIKELPKPIEQITPQVKTEIDPFIAFQQSIQFQKEQQAKIDAQKQENIRRYQQQLRDQVKPTQPQQTFKLPETANWARHPSQNLDQSQPLNFAEIQKQEQEQERRAREAAITAQQMAKSDPSSMSNSQSSSNKSNSWARTLFSGTGGNPIPTSADLDTHEDPTPESPITSYNQQATNAPKSRSTTGQSSTPWNTASSAPQTSLQAIQRQQQQQAVNESKTQQVHPNTAAHPTPAWGGASQHSSTPSQSSSSSSFWTDHQNPIQTSKSTGATAQKSSTPWTEVKSSNPPKQVVHPTNAELSKSEREVKSLFTATRTQDALSKWTQTQFKDNAQAIDVPTLVQLLTDIENVEEIVDYVQPYLGLLKAKEFAFDFISKRKQLAKAEPELDNESLNELAMAPTSNNKNSGNGSDEGFQLASNNGQKKKAKKKGQKLDGKQLNFTVNNRPEQRESIDKVPM